MSNHAGSHDQSESERKSPSQPAKQHGYEKWLEVREEWTEASRSNTEPVKRNSGTSIFVSPHSIVRGTPFPHPVPLGEMIEMLNIMWCEDKWEPLRK
ncbi:hypothetical protein BSKO_02300 [Bryopsis sp. KO-2023]|nr:hypothetical protein BSKO_02300 [Bryopsis sp. KO-2023]